MNTKQLLPILFSFVFLSLKGLGQQQDSTSLFEADFVNIEASNEEVLATFKTTRIANGHSVEQVKRGILDFRINHRFGRISDGISNFFGLDNAVTRIGFDYGITDKLMVGLGRSTLNKEYDTFAKYQLLRQKKKDIPISISLLAGAYAVSQQYAVKNLAFVNRLSYLGQLLIARKFNENLSIQLMPTYTHFNMTDKLAESNDLFSLGIGARQKITKRTAITAEYYYVPDRYMRDKNYSPLTIGFDIDTGGHVFQLFFSNATGISERSMFTSTQSRWEKGELHFGFNISRVFTLHSKSK